MKNLEGFFLLFLFSLILSLQLSIGIKLAFDYDMGILGPFLIFNSGLGVLAWIKALIK